MAGCALLDLIDAEPINSPITITYSIRVLHRNGEPSKPQRWEFGVDVLKVHERLNIIFIDPHYISRPVPHDHKLIDRELDTFPIHIRQGITTLYLRNV